MLSTGNGHEERAGLQAQGPGFEKYKNTLIVQKDRGMMKTKKRESKGNYESNTATVTRPSFQKSGGKLFHFRCLGTNLWHHAHVLKAQCSEGSAAWKTTTDFPFWL